MTVDGRRNVYHTLTDMGRMYLRSFPEVIVGRRAAEVASFLFGFAPEQDIQEKAFLQLGFSTDRDWYDCIVVRRDPADPVLPGARRIRVAQRYDGGELLVSIAEVIA